MNIDVRMIKIAGLEAPIEATSNHPIYSEKVQDFVRADRLSAGEQLRTRSGVATIESVGRKPGQWEVFNLEVGEVHQYYVSELEVLVHNAGGACGPGTDIPSTDETSAPVQENEVTDFQDFVDRSVKGDNLEGHEPWQHANLIAQDLVDGERLSSPASQDNPVIALDKATHSQLTRAQSQVDASAMTPTENINFNLTMMRLLDSAPEEAVSQLEQLVRQHAQNNGF